MRLDLATLLVCAACSRPGLVEAPHSQSTALLATPPRPTVTRPNVAILPAGTEAESVTETAQLTGPDGLNITVAWDTMTGTTHVARELTLTSPGGTLRFAGRDFSNENNSDPLYVEALPLVERILPAGPRRWLLLGWSSLGEGMQSEHVWLAGDEAGGPRVLDSLVWTTDRLHSGVVLDPSTPAVGIPLPDRAEPLHNPTWWQLRHSDRWFSFDGAMHLPTQQVDVNALRAYYDPPDDEPPPTRHWAGRVAWFNVRGTELVPSSAH
jgi:hypothetical protein